MRVECALRERFGRWRGPCSCRRRRCHCAVAMLVPLAAAAGTRIVASRCGCRRSARARLRKQHPGVGVVGQRRMPTLCQRRRCGPLARSHRVANELRHLQRFRDRVGEGRRERCELGVVDDAREVEQPVKPERPTDRMGRFEGEPLGERLVREADGEFGFEQRPKGMTDCQVLRVLEDDTRILQCLQQLA